MSVCGIDHARAYKANTGKLATMPRITRMNQSCAAWREQLGKTYQTPSVTAQEALEKHAIVGRFWDAHMEDIGAS